MAAKKLTAREIDDLHIEQILKIVEQVDDRQARIRLLSQAFCMSTGATFAG
jgi:hypothetical protein